MIKTMKAALRMRLQPFVNRLQRRTAFSSALLNTIEAFRAFSKTQLTLALVLMGKASGTKSQALLLRLLPAGLGASAQTINCGKYAYSLTCRLCSSPRLI